MALTKDTRDSYPMTLGVDRDADVNFGARLASMADAELDVVRAFPGAEVAAVDVADDDASWLAAIEAPLPFEATEKQIKVMN